MQLFLYAGKNNGNEGRLEASIQAAAPEEAIERFTRMDDLRERLRFIVEPQSIVVLVATDRKELQQMQTFHDLLTKSFVILVLPDGEESTIRLAHLLQPRFITQFDDDFKALNQIVAKMMRIPH